MTMRTIAMRKQQNIRRASRPDGGGKQCFDIAHNTKIDMIRTHKRTIDTHL